MWLLNKCRMLKRWYLGIWHYKRKFTAEIEKKVPMSKKIKYALLGFSEDEYICYHLDVNDYREYISRWERLKLEDVNGRYASLLGMKVLFEGLVGRVIDVPHIYFWVRNGRIYNLHGSFSEKTFLDTLRQQKQLIAKPTVDSGSGRGVLLFEWETNCFKVNGEVLDEEDLLQLVRTLDEYIFTQRVLPGGLSKSIFPKTANTMRIVTAMIDGKATTLVALHRFGTEKSFPVDGGAYGGIMSSIDIKTGTLGKALAYSGEQYSCHPDTGARIEGVSIPEWTQILSKLENAHNCLPYYEFFAWDAVVADDGKLYAIEINRGTDCEFLQLEHGQRDGLLGKYMRSKEYLSR